MTGLAMLWGRSKIADSLPPIANVTISNVPGPQVPLYMAGAKVNTYYPVSIPAHSMALNMTVQSYNGMLDYGLIACRRAVPDIDDLANYVVAAHQELDELAAKQNGATLSPVSAPAEPDKRPATAARSRPA
jgi:diacylglycerol O-acyltransferase